MAAAPIARPAWLPAHMPGLDGLRGIAIVLVVLFHCERELRTLRLGWLAHWGWTGVNLFFVLSGFLITGIILDQRGETKFFRSFYARRGLRIWPLYFALLAVTYAVFGPANLWNRPSRLWLTHQGVPWLIFLGFAQNLTPGLAGTIFPTWSLAIEEQFYVAWAPLARRVHPLALAAALGGALAFEPWCRAYFAATLTPVNSLFKLDGLAVGCLIALGLRTLGWSEAEWRRVGWAAIVAGLAGCEYAWLQGGPFFDTFLAVGFGGLLLAAITTNSRRNAYLGALSSRPLAYLGTISYGLYLTHMPVFALLGGLDHRLAGAGAAGAAALLAARWTASLAVASASWFGFERPILKLKRHFKPAGARPERAPLAVGAG